MSFPAGSTLKVTLLNGASPNTGPFDIYVNSVLAGNLVADDVLKTTLSSSGYEFVTPVDTLAVVAKSDGSITTEDMVILGNMPGQTKQIFVTGSYNSALNAGLMLSNVYLDSGYGLQTVNSISSALTSCPATTVIGTGSIESQYNTLVVVKTHDTGSNLIKFFANGSATSDYFYHIPSLILNDYAGVTTGSGPNQMKVCIDLSGTNYQTAAVASVNVYPPALLEVDLYYPEIKVGDPTNTVNIVKANGNVVYSSSLFESGLFSVPGNALIEVSSSVFKIVADDTTYMSKLTGSMYLTYGDYDDSLIANQYNELLVESSTHNGVNYKFYAVPGATHTLLTTSWMGLNTTLIDHSLQAGSTLNSAAAASPTTVIYSYENLDYIISGDGVIFYSNATEPHTHPSDGYYVNPNLNVNALHSYYQITGGEGVVTLVSQIISRASDSYNRFSMVSFNDALNGATTTQIIYYIVTTPRPEGSDFEGRKYFKSIDDGAAFADEGWYLKPDCTAENDYTKYIYVESDGTAIVRLPSIG